MAEGKRLPFQTEWTPEDKPKKGLKVSNERSVIEQTKQQKVDFEHMADEFMVERAERNKKAIELARQFMEIIRDKTLAANKSPMAQDIEKELCAKLINLALVVNQDESEPEGYGSVAVINLLLKTLLVQRDHINTLEYRIAQLEKPSSAQRRTP